MRSQRRADTRPEILLRKALTAAGCRYRVDAALPGMRRRADLLFTRAKVAVFVDGCFWHACPRHATWPKANAAWWRAKLEANRARDRHTDALLRASGWRVVRVYEHVSTAEAARRVLRVLARASADLAASTKTYRTSRT